MATRQTKQNARRIVMLKGIFDASYVTGFDLQLETTQKYTQSAFVTMAPAAITTPMKASKLLTAAAALPMVSSLSTPPRKRNKNEKSRIVTPARRSTKVTSPQRVNKKQSNDRTESFGAMWDGVLNPNTRIQPHTLILGTHPSIVSLQEGEYYAHPMKYVLRSCAVVFASVV
jgi:hypothetical protein